MHPVRVVLATLLAACALVLVAPTPPASACSCAVQSRAEHVANASAVFMGTLVDRSSDEQAVAYTFEVEEVFKGSVTRTTRVTTAADGAACGLSDLTQDEDYLVFAGAGREDDALTVSLCGGTVGVGPTPIERVEGLTGAGRAPEPGGPTIDDGEPFVAYWLMAAAGIGAFGLLMVAVRRGQSGTER